jgi:chromosome segregation ATPase
VTFDIDDAYANEFRYGDPERVDTIALLQEEIVRLEAELQARGEGTPESVSIGVSSTENEFDRPSASEYAAPSHPEVERLRGDLATREETVAFLLDQLSLLEDARTADRAEWEQLAGWVAELEQRVEGQDEEALCRLQARLANEQRKAEELQKKLDLHHHAWEAQRAAYEGKLAQLQEGLEQAQALARAREDDDQIHPGSGRCVDAVSAVQAENLRLAALREMEERTAGENSAALHSRLGELEKERDEALRQLEHVQDERRRERLEHEAVRAELRTLHARAVLVQPQLVKAPEDRAREMEPYLRIQALREHLLEIHEQEAEERRKRSVTSRLSRLWSRTSPR